MAARHRSGTRAVSFATPIDRDFGPTEARAAVRPSAGGRFGSAWRRRFPFATKTSAGPTAPDCNTATASSPTARRPSRHTGSPTRCGWGRYLRATRLITSAITGHWRRGSAAAARATIAPAATRSTWSRDLCGTTFRAATAWRPSTAGRLTASGGTNCRRIEYAGSARESPRPSGWQGIRSESGRTPPPTALGTQNAPARSRAGASCASRTDFLWRSTTNCWRCREGTARSVPRKRQGEPGESTCTWTTVRIHNE